MANDIKESERQEEHHVFTNKKDQCALIASAWGHKGSIDHLARMGEGLYNRYCLGDDYSETAKDYDLMVTLCEQLKTVDAKKKK